MKFVKSVLLALSMLGPAVVFSGSVQAQSYDCYDPETDLIEATCALMGRARLALNTVNPLVARDPNVDLANAKRYSQAIINGSDQLATLLQSSASDEAILTQLDSLKTTVLQLDATKRKLQLRYPANTALTRALTNVRNVYFNLEALLLPDAE